MATPTPTATPIPTHIKSAARKLPIKRKTPPQSSDPILTPSPIPISISNPNPNFLDADPSSSSALVLSNGGGGEEEEDYEFDDDEEDGEEEEAYNNNNNNNGGNNNSNSSSNDLNPCNPNPNPNPRAPPFKFHRIWSESDEIRFLQGLLGCFSQGLVFPRDLNLFYDRFSESMPQPYTRSQLSEKLRRLRKKYRIMSARIARGQDPSRLAPHDRDPLHLCTRLWHPDHSSSSPFAAPEASSSSKGNKRRRPNPRTPVTPLLPPPVPAAAAPPHGLEFSNGDEESQSEDDPALALPPPPPPPPPQAAAAKTAIVAPVITQVPAADAVDRKGDVETKAKRVAAKTVLDAFDGSLEELRRETAGGSGSGSEMERRWREQRVAELDVFARRLRLRLEQSLC